MSSTWGNNIKLSIFGESHGSAIGIVIDGLSSGIQLDLDNINWEMKRRAPGKNELSTSRMEKDNFEIVSGFFEGKTTGTPLCVIIRNSDMNSGDYNDMKSIMRPGHADFTGFLKYNGFNDYRGGGHFSGRITATIVFAGAVAKQILKSKNIIIASHIKSIKEIEDRSFDLLDIDESILSELSRKEFIVLDDKIGDKMKKCILDAKKNNDSVGGIIECAVINLPSGIGSPLFNSVESVLAHLLFSVPSVKGVEFGAGFKISSMLGSEANDEFYFDEDKVKTYTNNNGGLLGGITNGMPLIFRCAIKPTPSIGKTQRTINVETKKNVKLSIAGRHDSCIVQRAIPVVEAITALAILDMAYI